jgi:hypothetical protein
MFEIDDFNEWIEEGRPINANIIELYIYQIQILNH